MKRMLMIAALLACSPTLEAVAGLDPYPDSFGVYFDVAGNADDCAVGPFMPFHAYLIVSNPTAPFDAFECLVSLVGAPHFVLSTALGEAAVDSDASADGYRVTRATPYPVVQQVVVLVDWLWMLQVPAAMWAYVGPGTDPLLPGGLPVLGHAGAYRLGGVSSSSPDFPVACVNAWGCSNADEPTSFGALKSLYR